MITFKYKNNRYTVELYPCGHLASVYKNNRDNRRREVRFSTDMTVTDFLRGLEKINFDY